MSASSRTIQATPNMGRLAIVFAALLAGTALIVALAYGQMTASQGSLAPAAAPAPAVAYDHGWSSESRGPVSVGRDSGWIDTTPIRPAARDSGWIDTTPIRPAARDSGWIDTTPIRPAARDSGWIDTTPIRPKAHSNAFDKSHHAVKRRFDLVEERGFGGK